MRILAINPNTLVELAHAVALTVHDRLPHQDVIAFCPTKGPTSIESEHDAWESAWHCMEELGNLPGTMDGIIVACYSDHPLIPVLRDRFDKPVIGILQASLRAADNYGMSPFIVTSGDGWIPVLSEYLSHRSQEGLVRAVHASAAHLFSNTAGTVDAIRREILEVDNSGNYALCLGCAAMAGLAGKIAPFWPHPVIDGVEAAAEWIEEML